MPYDSAMKILGSFRNFRFYTPTHPILQDLQSSGRFDLIESQELRNLLTEYIQEKDRLAVVEERERWLISNLLEPYLAKQLDLGILLSEVDTTGTFNEYKRFLNISKSPELGSLIYMRRERTESALRFSGRVNKIIDDVKALLDKLD